MSEWTAKRDEMKKKEGAALKKHSDESDSIEESNELHTNMNIYIIN